MGRSSLWRIAGFAESFKGKGKIGQKTITRMIDSIYTLHLSSQNRSLPSKASNLAPNIRNHTTYTRGPMPAMIHPPTTPGEPVQFPQ